MKNTIVVYSGRFQPFHKGHFGVYQNLVKKFGKKNVFIGTSNKQDPIKSPFSFKEKKEIITKLFGVDPNVVVQVKNPYNPQEILSKYDPKETAYVTVVSEKDSGRLKGKYFHKWDGKPELGYKEGGYLYISPMFGDNISASEVRAKLSSGTTEEKQKFFKKVYPKFNKSIFDLITTRLSSVSIKKEAIEKWVQQIGNYGNIFEGTSTLGGGAVDDGPLGFFRNMEIYKNISVKRAAHIGYTVFDMLDKGRVEDITNHPDYPNGPTKTVSYYPAGVIGKMTSNNQIDVYSSSAFSKWFKHVTRTASMVGYQVIHNQIVDDDYLNQQTQSGHDAEKIEDLANEFNKFISESIEIPIEIGDTILTGKFKNKKVVVKTIGKNEWGLPTINGKNIMNIRLVKEGLAVDFKSDVITESEHKLKMSIPKKIKDLHKIFKKEGYKLYIVGGAVRDAILGKNPHDFDLTTDATPDEVLEIAKKYGLHSTEVGKQFGVVVIDGDEIATFRKDSIGTSRMNTKVEYTDIKGDVARRDLTINALFYDLDTNEIVDLVGGIADLKNKQIRTVGVASERFKEDPLRKLRALRFTSRVGGRLEKETYEALKSDVSLKGVSPERIKDEFFKSIQSAKDPSSYLKMMYKLGYLQLVFPGMIFDTKFSTSNDPIVTTSKLLRKLDVKVLGKKLNKLRYSAEEVRQITFLIMLSRLNKDTNISPLKKLEKVSNISTTQIKDFGNQIGKNFDNYIKFKLTIKGSDVPKDVKGREIGKWISDKENELFKKVMKENNDVNKRKLIESIDKFIKIVESNLYLNEDLTKDDLKTVEKSADTKLKPIDVKFTNHFLDRVNDPRNGKEITKPELINFFKRLSRSKKHFGEFLKKYREIMVKDKQTNINIPFVQKANKLIAKTIMRTANWRQRKTPEFYFESLSNGLENLLNEKVEDCDIDKKPTIQDVVDKFDVPYEDVKRQLKIGSKIEKEHSDDVSIAVSISMDHLMEYPYYYDDLVDMEKQEKKKLKEGTEENPTVTMLVGPPASGKSTWVSKHGKGQVVISRDDIVDKYAKKHGISYNETFSDKDIQNNVNKDLENHIVKTLKSGKSFIVDMTNMSKMSRKRMLDRVPENYTKKAVVFNVSRKELEKRLMNREKETGKHIPPHVIDNMLARYEKPTKGEFDVIVSEGTINEVKTPKTFKELLKMMPPQVQKLVMNLKNVPQSAEHHPEGNVLKHTITVVNRALKHAPGDMDLAVSAMFHDLGKANTAGINKKGNITHYGHEKVSKEYVKKFANDIKKIGADPDNVYFIVGNHMRMHQFDKMKPIKQDKLKINPVFDKLQQFAKKMDGGGLHLDNEVIETLISEFEDKLEEFVLPEIKLNEGGKATGGSPIPAEYGLPMYNDVVKELGSLIGITKNDAKPLGSTGKRPKGQFSGDIDIALDGNVIASKHGLKFDEVEEFLYKKVKSSFKNVVHMKGLGIVSFLYPIPNSENFGQVDLMLTDNLELSSFMYHSPNFIKNESKYKGLYRNALLFSIVKYMDVDDKPEYFENGDVKKFKKFTLSQKKGLITQIKSYEGKLGKQLKNCKPIKGCDVPVTKNPTDIVKFIFGDKYSVKDINSFEDIYKIVMSSDFKHKHHRKEILDNFKSTILNGVKMPLPSELD